MKFLNLLLAVLFIAGCNITPGTDISEDRSPNTLIYDEPVVKANVVLITPALMRELAASQPPRVTDEFFIKNSQVDEDYRYKIGIGDVLTVTVWEHPELTIPFGQFRDAEEQGIIVYEDGSIFYPYAGNLQAAGKTVVEMREDLRKALSKYIENPQVDVRVSVFKSQQFYLTGSVKIPGTYPVTHIPLRLLEAINQAGGFLEDADIYSVRITRNGVTTQVPIYDMLYLGDLTSNILIKHGDVLHVGPDQQRRVFVMGEVNEPKSMKMTHQPMTLTQVIAEVGGVKELSADASGVYVIRQSEIPEVVNVFQLDITEAYALSLADDFILNSRDIVYVSAAPMARWNRFVSNLVPFFTGAIAFGQVSN